MYILEWVDVGVGGIPLNFAISRELSGTIYSKLYTTFGHKMKVNTSNGCIRSPYKYKQSLAVSEHHYSFLMVYEGHLVRPAND